MGRRFSFLELLLALCLMGTARSGTILLVTDDNWKNSRVGSAGAPEDDFVAWLTGDLGHTVYRSGPEQYRKNQEGAAGAAAFASADGVELIIVSRVTRCGPPLHLHTSEYC
jgi:hypothetical protein